MGVAVIVLPSVCCVLPPECAPELAAIELESNHPPWTPQLFAGEFSNRFSTIYGARIGGRLAAFLVCRVAADEAHIVNLAVVKELRRRGIARNLLSHVLHELFAGAVSTVYLEVRSGNRAARRLYESAGFIETAIKQAYYSDNREDGLVMKLNLQSFAGHRGTQKPAVGGAKEEFV